MLDANWPPQIPQLTGAILCLALLVVAPLAQPQDDRSRELIGKHIDALVANGSLKLDDIAVRAVNFLPRFYENRQYALAWSDPANFAALIEGIQMLADHGLSAAEFRPEKLMALKEEAVEDPSRLADLDILLTDAMARLLRQLWFGKVDPVSLDANWNYARPNVRGDPVTVVDGVLADGELRKLIAAIELRHPYYLTLKASLRNHREIASAGGWLEVPADGPSLKPGMRGSRITALRMRMTRSGDYSSVTPADPAVYDVILGEAVRRFQARNGLGVDGIVGKDTLSAMNVPVEGRIDQIRVNMERARWVLRDLGEKFVVINIAGFYVRAVRDGLVAWQSPVIVGKPYHKTPVFRGTMRYLVINPDWTVPRSIIVNEIAPAVIADPDYLEKHNFYLVDAARDPIDAALVDWAAVSPSTLTFSVVQAPGANNALGRVKFMFPNKHSVYLHDTPGRGLFSRSGRTFSHGCIRVKDPFELAELMLSDKPGWNRRKMDQLVRAGKLTRVNLEWPVPVMVLYWTVDPDISGNVNFYKDVYGRDPAILAALNN